MADNRDYDIVIGKVSHTNSKGEDVSQDELGTGGRRDESGQLSALAYDLKYYEEGEEEEEVDKDTVESKTKKSSESLLETLANMIDSTDSELVKGILVGATGVITTFFLIKGTKKFIIPWIKDKFSRNTATKKIETVADEDEQDISVIDLSQLENAVDEYRKDMSDEEKQKHLLNIAYHALCLMNEMKAMVGVSVTREDWDKAVQTLCSESFLAPVNQILVNNSALLPEPVRNTLADILSFEPSEEGELVELRPEMIEKAFACSETDYEEV